MPANQFALNMVRKSQLLGRWPGRLDQELRQKFGEAIAPKTHFDKQAQQYKTDFTEVDGVDSAAVLAFIEGYQIAISSVLEQ